MKEKVDLNDKTILITSSSGFIGANLALRLLKEMDVGTIVSVDNMNGYYDPGLKEYRLNLINEASYNTPVDHTFIKASIANKRLMDDVFGTYHPSVVVNLAAQAGVKYSIDYPDAYADTKGLEKDYGFRPCIGIELCDNRAYICRGY